MAGTIRGELSPSTWIITQEHAPQAGPQVNLREALYQLRFPFADDPNSCQLEKQNKTKTTPNQTLSKYQTFTQSTKIAKSLDESITDLITASEWCKLPCQKISAGGCCMCVNTSQEGTT